MAFILDQGSSSCHQDLLSITRSGMRAAIQQAQNAYDRHEVPVGAALVYQGKILSQSYNSMKAHQNPTSHAEWLVIQEGLTLLKTPYLAQCTLYVTLEPCAFCASAITLVRLSNVVFGAYRPVGGAVVHGPRLWDEASYPTEWIGGVQERQCRSFLVDFFRTKRKQM